MPMELQATLRPATESDLDFVHRLVCDLEDQTFDREKFREFFQQNLSNPMVTYSIASLDGVDCGFVSVHTQSLLHHCGRIAEIQELVVAEAFRSRKVGQQVLHLIREACEADGIFQLEVCTNRKRVQAQRFYLANGFQDTHHKFCLTLA
ncbi:MAG: GNAT family N-acetyltransferase [Fibrobacterota bacterium]|nr:MAG: GNAT family N-acetyltransferase [Fibrobacterota bacterium]